MSKQDTYKAADGYNLFVFAGSKKVHKRKDGNSYPVCYQDGYRSLGKMIPTAQKSQFCKKCWNMCGDAIVEVKEDKQWTLCPSCKSMKRPVDQKCVDCGNPHDFDKKWRKCTREEAEEYRIRNKHARMPAWSNWSSMSRACAEKEYAEYEYRTSKPAKHITSSDAATLVGDAEDRGLCGESLEIMGHIHHEDGETIISQQDVIEALEASNLIFGGSIKGEEKDITPIDLGNHETIKKLQAQITELETQLSCAKTEFGQLQEERDGHKRERDEWKDAYNTKLQNEAELEKEYAAYIEISNSAQEELEKELEECKKGKEARLEKLSASRAAVSALNLQCEEMRRELTALEPLRPYVPWISEILKLLPPASELKEIETKGRLVKVGRCWWNGEGLWWACIETPQKVQYIPTEHITSKLIEHLGVLSGVVWNNEEDKRIATVNLVENATEQPYITSTTCFREWKHFDVVPDEIRRKYERLSEEAKAQALEELPWLKEYVG